jgi:hypothetical protein
MVQLRDDVSIGKIAEQECWWKGVRRNYLTLGTGCWRRMNGRLDETVQRPARALGPYAGFLAKYRES